MQKIRGRWLHLREIAEHRHRGGRAPRDPVVDQLRGWDLERYPGICTWVECILQNMTPKSVHALHDPRLQVVVIPEDSHAAWAYFPIHRQHSIVRRYGIRLRRSARVLLVISAAHVGGQSLGETFGDLAHHFGHVLAFLRNPARIHDCADANKVATEVGLGDFLHG